MSRREDTKNPFSNVGRDKFSEILSELEAKKKKIIARRGSRGDQVIDVHFKYSDSKDWVPVVIKPKGSKKQASSATKVTDTDEGITKKSLLQLIKEESVVDTKDVVKPAQDPEPIQIQDASEKRSAPVRNEKKKNMIFSCKIHYWHMVMFMILACLMLGKVFAIWSISLIWYLLPMLKDDTGNLWSFEFGKIVHGTTATTILLYYKPKE